MDNKADTLPVVAKAGFTLAEVIITLGIIGVISAMTIPGLLTKCQQAQTLARLKKTYSLLQQSLKLAADEYGDCESWDYTLTSKEFITRYFVPYTKLSYVNNLKNYTYTDLKNKKYNFPIKDIYVLPDGVFIAFYRAEVYQSKNFLIIDLNGTTQPNRLGHDIFILSFYEDKLRSYTQYAVAGADNKYFSNPANSGTSGQCNKSSSGGIMGAGSYCSTVIINNNWTIPPNYPW